MKCRHCQNELKNNFLDLGFAPHSNAYINKLDQSRPEKYFPLRLKVCEKCWLVQTEDFSSASDLFTADYAYFSSTSSSWLKHAKDYAEKITTEYSLNKGSLVIEVASNDGYLLKNFISKGIPVLGIEPTDSTADVAESINIPTLRSFFGESLAENLADKGKLADLIIGNNVYAHVPDINDFTKGLKRLLKNEGIITLEFPHLMKLLNLNQFDTVYHEHYSYLSLFTVQKIFKSCGLKIFKVEEIQTHGGSLRIYGCHENSLKIVDNSVEKVLFDEINSGMRDLDIYLEFQIRANKIKNEFLKFLIDQNHLGKLVLGYGAAAKGNTLLNYAGVKPDLIPCICDLAISKQGKLMPGSRIPITTAEEVFKYKPDYIFIFPWNIKEEVMNSYNFITEWGGKFVVAIPTLTIL
jgi:2-polyprenyl-3-methyl-5-hydroxy-6-metoxy-1,4-benzoquinol methylase